MATEFINKNVLSLLWKSDVLGTICDQPMMQDGAVRLFFFHAGLDCTKNPAKTHSALRMKGCVDEQHWQATFDTAAKLMVPSDTWLILSGKNDSFYKAARKDLRDLKPRVGIKELEIEPDEAQVAKLSRLESNSYGSVDLADRYMQVVKDPKDWKHRRAEDRRFVSGNTAFRKMSGVPLLAKSAMTTITHAEREKVFKGVVGSDKYSRSLRFGTGDDDAEAASEEDETEPVSDNAVVQPHSKVVFFYMELHPRVCLGKRGLPKR